MIRSLEHQPLAASFPPSLLSAGQARHFVTTGLRGAGVSDPGILDRMRLVTSELVTNAVLHAETDVVVRLAVDRADVWLEVVDEAPARPYRAPPSPMDTSGRGLMLVDALADGWGVTDVEGSLGKVVWIRVSRI